MHTMAAIALPTAADGGGRLGGSAVLSLNGAVLHARVIEPQGTPGFPPYKSFLHTRLMSAPWRHRCGV